MAGNGANRTRRGDIGFLVRLALGAAAVVLLGALLLGLLDRSRLGDCAARGFLQVTEPPPED